MVAQDQVVYKVNHKHAEDYGKLIARHQRTANVGGSYLGNIHGTNSGRQSHSDASQNAVEIKGDKQVHISLPIFKEQEFRIIRPQCRKEEKYGGQP